MHNDIARSSLLTARRTRLLALLAFLTLVFLGIGLPAALAGGITYAFAKLVSRLCGARR